jgi:hypothetical protein
MKQHKLMLWICIISILTILFSSYVHADPVVTGVAGRVFGPGKVSAKMNVTALEALNNNLTLFTAQYTVVDSRGQYVFFVTTDDNDDPIWLVIQGRNATSGTYGLNISKNSTSQQGFIAGGTDQYLNVTLHAPLDLTGPNNGYRFNFTTPSFNWTYVEEDFINYTLYIDDNSDFSSPEIVKNLHDVNYTLNAGESLADGTYYWRVVSVDINYSMQIDVSETRSFDIDTIAPNITAVYPGNITWINEGMNFQVTTNEPTYCTFDNESTIQFQTKRWNFGNIGTFHSYLFNFSWQGNHSFYIQCNDTAGNIMELSDEWFTIMSYDDIDPVTSHNFSYNNTWTQYDQVIELTRTDADPSSSYNWTRYCGAAACVPEAGLNYPMGTPLPYTEGTYVLRYASMDNAGNTESTNELRILIDQTQPTTSHNYATNNSWVNADQSITLTYSDPAPASGEQWTRYCLSGSSSCTPNIAYPGAAVPVTTNGNNWFRYHSRDIVNNTQEIVSLLVRVDKIAPYCSNATVMIENNATYATSTTLNFNWTGFDDNLSGISGYYHNYVNNEFTAVGTWDPSSPGVRNAAAQGLVTVYVWGRDAVGNIGCSANDSIIVDTIAPAFSNYDNDDVNEDYVGNLHLNVSINDATTNVTMYPQIRYRYNLTGPWTNWFDMTVVSYNGTGGIYEYDIPEPASTWNGMRHERVYWEINATDYVDNLGNAIQQSELVDEINDPPILNPILNYSTPALTLLAFNITADDFDNDGLDNQILSYSSNLSNISFVKFNNTLATVYWLPANIYEGSNIFNFTVTDDGTPNLLDWQLVEINVTFVNEPPVLDPIGDLSIDENETLIYDVNATDPNLDPIVFEDNSTLFNIDPNTGLINFSPDWTMVGNHSINISVHDDNFQGNLTDWEVINLEINNVENNITFFVQDRIRGISLPGINLTGGVGCANNCSFDYNYSFIEPNGLHYYNFTKSGFYINSTSYATYRDTNYTIEMSDDLNPEMFDLRINYTYNAFTDEYNLTITINATDNFILDNVSFNYSVLGPTITQNGIINMTEINPGEFFANIGPYDEEVLMLSTITAFDIYGNSLLNVNPDTYFILGAGTGGTLNYPPVMDSVGPKLALVGQPFSYKVNAFDPNADSLTFTDNTTIFNIDPTTGWINFTAIDANEGTHRVNISVADENFTDTEIVTFTIKKGNNVTFVAVDDLTGAPMTDVTLIGGLTCYNGCTFDDQLSFIELSGTYQYNLTREGYASNTTNMDAIDGITAVIRMTDISPPEGFVHNFTPQLTPPENRTFYVHVFANISDLSQVANVRLFWGLNGDYNDNNALMQSMGSGIYNYTLGPFNDTINIDSAFNATDIYGNSILIENYARKYFFRSGFEVREPHLVMSKNVVYVSEEVMNITYRIEERIYNTAGDDLTNILFIDTDIQPGFQYINIPRQSYVEYNNTITIDKVAGSATRNFVAGAATINGQDYYSNAPSVRIPGFGGPFDLIFNPGNIPSEAMSWVVANLTNMNPMYGQDAILYFWLENSTGDKLYERQETLYVPRQESTVVNRSMIQLDNLGTYFVKGNITWPVNQIALATAQFQVADTSCFDGIQNGDEHNIDCGGSCPPCPGCDNGVMDSEETDRDCGGSFCNPCNDFFMCSIDRDCISKHCVNGICVPATCNDGIKNQGETDIDCGGLNCAPCNDGLRCRYNKDCVSYWCDSGICRTANHCYDGTQNQDESDIDCGGVCITKCQNYQKCYDWSDCASERCELGICLPQTCNDGIKNQNEEGVDCGGKCTPCSVPSPPEPPSPEPPQYFEESFGNTTISVSDDASVISLTKNVSKNLIKYGDEIDVSLIIRNFYKYYQTALINDTIPKGFTLVEPGIADVNGNVLSWNLDLRTDPSRIVTYRLRYNEKYLTMIETLAPEKTIDDKVVLFQNKIKIRRIRELIEKLYVEKLIDYSKKSAEATITNIFKNAGDLILEDIYINDNLVNNTKVIDRQNIVTLKNNVWMISELESEEKESITYVTPLHDMIEYYPRISGIDEDNVEYNIRIKGEPYQEEAPSGIVYFFGKNWWWLLILILITITTTYFIMFAWLKKKHNINLFDLTKEKISSLNQEIPNTIAHVKDVAIDSTMKIVNNVRRERNITKYSEKLATNVESLIKEKLSENEKLAAQKNGSDMQEFLKTKERVKNLLEDLKNN